MATPADFTNDELHWLLRVKQSDGTYPPEPVAMKLVAAGVADRTDRGLKITDLGVIVLDKGQGLGRVWGRSDA
jgi:hypothetical protein